MIASLDNLLFLLLIGLAALFQLLSSALKKGSKNESQDRSKSPAPQALPPVRRAPPESDADRIRKFLEALGQPASSTPPPPVVPRTGIPPRPLAPVQPPAAQFPGTRRLPREQRKPDMSGSERPAREQPRHMELIPPGSTSIPRSDAYAEPVPPRPNEPPVVKAPGEAYTAFTGPIMKQADFQTDIITLIRSNSTLRGAIILREILGPPRGLEFQAWSNGVME